MGKRSKQKANARKVTRGNGWEFIPAKGERAPKARGSSKAPADQRIVVREERRKDKAVTVARGFELLEKDLKSLGKTLKAKLASGGKAEDDVIEVQGRHRDKMVALLEACGYVVQAR